MASVTANILPPSTFESWKRFAAIMPSTISSQRTATLTTACSSLGRVPRICELQYKRCGWCRQTFFVLTPCTRDFLVGVNLTEIEYMVDGILSRYQRKQASCQMFAYQQCTTTVLYSRYQLDLEFLECHFAQKLCARQYTMQRTSKFV